MKSWKKLGLSACLTFAFLTSCETKAQSGALGGAVVGGMTGMAIGNSEGALIGSAVGAMGGAMIGSAMDEQDRRILAAESPHTLERIEYGRQLSNSDVKAMARAGISDDIIISQIQSTRSRFHLSTTEIIELKDYGVSDRVINYMVQTGRY